MHKLPIIPYNLRKHTTKQKPSKSKPMTTLTPGSSNLQNTITPSPNPTLSPTSTSQNIQSSPSISTSPPVNPTNSSTTTLSLTNPKPAVAFASSPQNLDTAPSTEDNLLAFEDHYENEFLQHPPVETYLPTTTNCNKPMFAFLRVRSARRGTSLVSSYTMSLNT